MASIPSFGCSQDQAALSGPFLKEQCDALPGSEPGRGPPAAEGEPHRRPHFRARGAPSPSPASHRRGDAVEILYDPFHPADARIDHGDVERGHPGARRRGRRFVRGAGPWMALRRRRTPFPQQGG